MLFANAGGGEFAPLGQISEAHFDKTFDINVKGIPAFGVYAASKAALRSFARTWSVDLRDRRIRVNIIAPGTVVTPAYKSFMTDEQIEGFTAQVAATTPLGRASAPRMRLPGRWSSSRTQRWMTVTSDGVNRGFSMKRSSPAE